MWCQLNLCIYFLFFGLNSGLSMPCFELLVNGHNNDQVIVSLLLVLAWTVDWTCNAFKLLVNGHNVLAWTVDWACIAFELLVNGMIKWLCHFYLFWPEQWIEHALLLNYLWMVIIIDCMCNAHRLVCILSMNFSSGVCPSCMVNVSLEVFFIILPLKCSIMQLI